jgi:hypothetical protein
MFHALFLDCALFAAKRAAAMDTHPPTQDLPSATEDFADILEFTLVSCVPANPEDSLETRARKLAAARRQFAAFHPNDDAEAQAAAMAVAIMLGAVDSLARAARPGIGNETAGRLRGNALTAARFYTTTLDKIRKRNRQAADDAAPRRKIVEPADPPQEQEPLADIPKIEVFQPRDRRGKQIPGWRFDLLSMKQRRATYDFANKAAWAEATEEEDAAIAEQAELDARSPPTEEDLSHYLPITVQVSAGEPTETEGSGAAGGT